MEIIIDQYPGDSDWSRCQNLAALTMGNVMGMGRVVESAWKEKILRAQHSPIRVLPFTIVIIDIPYRLAMHYVRHKVGFESFVQTQRNDRQSEYDCNAARQDKLISLAIHCNAEALMTMMRKRLCHKAGIEIVGITGGLRKAVVRKVPEIDGMLKPPCELYGKCFEMKPCGKCTEPNNGG